MTQDWYDFSEGDRVVSIYADAREVWVITRVWSTGKVEARSTTNGDTHYTHARNLIYT